MANWVKGDDLLAFINDFGYTVQQCLCTGNSVGRFKLGDCYPGSGNWALCKKVLTTPNLLYTTLELHIFYILHLNSGIGTGKPGGKDATNGWLAKIRTDIFNQIIHRKLGTLSEGVLPRHGMKSLPAPSLLVPSNTAFQQRSFCTWPATRRFPLRTKTPRQNLAFINHYH